MSSKVKQPVEFVTFKRRRERRRLAFTSVSFNSRHFHTRGSCRQPGSAEQTEKNTKRRHVALARMLQSFRVTSHLCSKAISFVLMRARIKTEFVSSFRTCAAHFRLFSFRLFICASTPQWWRAVRSGGDTKNMKTSKENRAETSIWVYVGVVLDTATVDDSGTWKRVRWRQMCAWHMLWA